MTASCIALRQVGSFRFDSLSLRLTLTNICLFVCQEGEWFPVKEFFEKNADEAAKRKLRSLPQKKAYLEKRGFQLQKDKPRERLTKTRY